MAEAIFRVPGEKCSKEKAKPEHAEEQKDLERLFKGRVDAGTGPYARRSEVQRSAEGISKPGSEDRSKVVNSQKLGNSLETDQAKREEQG